ncbi:MAG: hypothetical protein TE42_03375 [Candidatus Synechococcus spongiarum SP3]|uniref:Uncharacterized protein n=1 Tax=Candidatus Synechococcus spongiarum SP3 TaxID=1604020 RepID=A0A0G2HLS4_9SYNE|nr:MAG: hypothetical protein TE42_03375 [Candidatus Synechococcus spongiarum SP3]
MPDPLLGARVVEGYHKVSQGGGMEALLDGGPGGELVTQADDAKIMHQRSAKAGGCHLQCGNTGMYGKAGTLLFRQVQPTRQGEAGQAVNATVAGGDEGHPLPLTGHGQRRCATLLLLAQDPVKPQLVGSAQRLQTVQIGTIAHPGGGCGQRGSGCRGQLIQRPRTTANEIQRTPTGCPGTGCQSNGTGGGAGYLFSMDNRLGRQKPGARFGSSTGSS